MNNQSPEEVVKEFINRINAQDNYSLENMMPEDFVFIDAQDRRMGKEDTDWAEYFRMFPDYKIHIEETLTKGNTVVILGSYSQTYAVEGQLIPENHYKGSAVWRANVKDGAIILWQVYTDYTRTYEIINRNKKESE